MWDSSFEIKREADFKCPLMGGIETPEVHFNEETLEKMRYLCKKFPKLEWMAGMIGKKEKTEKGADKYLIERIYLIEQEVAGATVEATKNGIKQLAETENTVGWIHSHNDMNSFQSSTDYDTAHNYNLTMTTNNKEDITGIAKVKLDCPKSTIFIMKEVDVYVPSIEVKVDVDLDKEINEKIKEKSVNYVKIQTGLYSSEGIKETIFEKYGKDIKKDEKKDRNNEEIDWFDEHLCSCCYSKLTEKDEVDYCPVCGQPSHKNCLSENGGICVLCEEVRQMRIEQIEEERQENGYDEYDCKASKLCSKTWGSD